MKKNKDLLSMEPTEIQGYIQALNVPAYRAKQLYSWILRAAPLQAMTNIPQDVKDKVKSDEVYNLPNVVIKQVSPLDGTTKILLELADRETVECVTMFHHDRISVCVSSQVGCRMGCKFCASTKGGLSRNLTSGEILAQVLIAKREANADISNVVLMGIGEPLDNFDNVVAAIRLMCHQDGLNLSTRNVTLSTCGLVDKIDLLAKESLPITLSVSLHTASDDIRSELMPVARRWTVAELLASCANYFRATGRRVTFEYTLFDKINDRDSDAYDLAEILRKFMPSMPLHVNLIPANEIPGQRYRPSSPARTQKFSIILKQQGISTTTRRSLGSDIDAACGQLRHSNK